MSEFECKNGHTMRSGEYFCKVCGERIATMDGMTRSEAKREDQEDYDEAELEEIDNS